MRQASELLLTPQRYIKMRQICHVLSVESHREVLEFLARESVAYSVEEIVERLSPSVQLHTKTSIQTTLRKLIDVGVVVVYKGYYPVKYTIATERLKFLNTALNELV